MFEQAAELLEDLGGYVKTAYKLGTIKITRKTVDVLVAVIMGVLIAVAAFIGLIFVSVATAMWLGEYLQNGWLGFLWVGCFYVLLLLVLLLGRKNLFGPYFKNMLTKQLYEKQDKSV
jgi:hypothetical protein